MRKSKIFILILLLLVFGCSKNQTANRLENPNNPSAETENQISAVDERAGKLKKIKDSVAPFFQPMRTPEGADWRATFDEPGQTFEEYLNAAPTLPTAERRVIYIQPLGKFSRTQMKVLQLTADYMKAFYNLPVELNAALALENVPAEMRRENPFDGQTQLKTGYFLDELLPKMLPADAAAFICFTNYDLYPDEDWNYVFGQATLQERVGVWSLWRFGNPDKSAEDFRLFLARTLKIAMHETGHMFTMLHCTKYECLMSGTNHLGETDRRPLDACPECAAKISWAMNYEPAARYRNLAEFWKSQNRTDEEKSFAAKASAIERAGN